MGVRREKVVNCRTLLLFVQNIRFLHYNQVARGSRQRQIYVLCYLPHTGTFLVLNVSENLQTTPVS